MEVYGHLTSKRLTSVILCVVMVAALFLAVMPTVSATVETGVTTNPCTDGFINFEEGTDGATIVSPVPGVRFSTTMGLNWIYGDIRTGGYNVYPYGTQAYVTNDNFFAWLGVSGDVGRIDFTEGTATYVSVLTSTYSGLVIDAYDSSGNFLATSGWASNNLWTGTFDLLTVRAPDIAYILIHDQGNYWLIDDLCTDAPSVPPLVIPATIEINPHTLNLRSKGKWITAYIELPEGYDVDDIDVGSISLNGLLVEWADAQDGVLMVKFDRQAVQAIVSVGDEVGLTVTGEVDGIPFEGSDTIRAIMPGKGKGPQGRGPQGKGPKK